MAAELPGDLLELLVERREHRAACDRCRERHFIRESRRSVLGSERCGAASDPAVYLPRRKASRPSDGGARGARRCPWRRGRRRAEGRAARLIFLDASVLLAAEDSDDSNHPAAVALPRTGALSSPSAARGSPASTRSAHTTRHTSPAPSGSVRSQAATSATSSRAGSPRSHAGCSPPRQAPNKPGQLARGGPMRQPLEALPVRAVPDGGTLQRLRSPAAAVRLSEPTCLQGSCEVELGGLEPPTSWVRSRRSPN